LPRDRVLSCDLRGGSDPGGNRPGLPDPGVTGQGAPRGTAVKKGMRGRMKLQIVAKELEIDEGYWATPRRCTKGKLTAGHGHNLDANGLTKEQQERLNYYEKDFAGLIVNREQAQYLLEDDIWVSFHELLKIFPGFQFLPDEIQHVLINLHFQLGYSRFTGFRDMIRAVKKQDWKEAAVELRDSDLWRKDKSDRTERRAKRFEAEAKRCQQKK